MTNVETNMAGHVDGAADLLVVDANSIPLAPVEAVPGTELTVYVQSDSDVGGDPVASEAGRSSEDAEAQTA